MVQAGKNEEVASNKIAVAEARWKDEEALPQSVSYWLGRNLGSGIKQGQSSAKQGTNHAGVNNVLAGQGKKQHALRA